MASVRSSARVDIKCILPLAVGMCCLPSCIYVQGRGCDFNVLSLHRIVIVWTTPQVARKAADLYQQQQAIEQLVTQRWDSASNGSSWPVQQLPAVQIDMFGRFPFVLAKAGDRLGAKKLLVRGRNGATEAQLVNSILKEVRRCPRQLRLGQHPRGVCDYGWPWLASAGSR